MSSPEHNGSSPEDSLSIANALLSKEVLDDDDFQEAELAEAALKQHGNAIFPTQGFPAAKPFFDAARQLRIKLSVTGRAWATETEITESQLFEDPLMAEEIPYGIDNFVAATTFLTLNGRKLVRNNAIRLGLWADDLQDRRVPHLKLGAFHTTMTLSEMARKRRATLRRASEIIKTLDEEAERLGYKEGETGNLTIVSEIKISRYTDLDASTAFTMHDGKNGRRELNIEGSGKISMATQLRNEIERVMHGVDTGPGLPIRTWRKKGAK